LTVLKHIIVLHIFHYCSTSLSSLS